jgi:hypothetical protein
MILSVLYQYEVQNLLYFETIQIVCYNYLYLYIIVRNRYFPTVAFDAKKYGDVRD